MQWVLDIGNTRVKSGVFDKSNIIKMWHSADLNLGEINNTLDTFPIDAMIVSDVRGNSFSMIQNLLAAKGMQIILMSHDTPTPLTMQYQSPATLGTDRLAASVYAYTQYAGQPILSIQTGSCFTFDYISPEGNYMGGAISPGMEMRFKALHTFTGKLPLVKKKEIYQLIGQSTEESILSGVINGCTAEIDGIIDQYKNHFPQIVVVGGGGDIFFFDKKLKNRIFAIENLVLKGLHKILNHNVKPEKNQ